MDRTELCPSIIHYTQDSINNKFGKPDDNKGKFIGESLDELCQGVCKVEDFEPIEVYNKGGHWWSADNRRLWVFKQFQRLGGCNTIPVKLMSQQKMDKRPFTTVAGGRNISVRGYPGGEWVAKKDGTLNLTHKGKRSEKAGRHVSSSKGPNHRTDKASRHDYMKPANHGSAAKGVNVQPNQFHSALENLLASFSTLQISQQPCQRPHMTNPQKSVSMMSSTCKVMHPQSTMSRDGSHHAKQKPFPTCSCSQKTVTSDSSHHQSKPTSAASQQSLQTGPKHSSSHSSPNAKGGHAPKVKATHQSHSTSKTPQRPVSSTGSHLPRGTPNSQKSSPSKPKVAPTTQGLGMPSGRNKTSGYPSQQKHPVTSANHHTRKSAASSTPRRSQAQNKSSRKGGPSK